ncbi:phycobilisome degradation protein nblA [Synechococcales cyanobacterium C]|uniref:Phycobilisome degradation protein nblA n=1 Tax=Petrachloros mirabilis ULC683 TaxID=2781853 RepID=A0A8K2A165_9CYAN|nr:NblA/ycf18 family protein [Petrachloros mirabilis]NCJ07733.1 phycobilisome degradation protein nblA [Petrachloros mirabilis ULC683]
MDIPLELSLEQKFNLKVYEEQIRRMNQEQAQTFLIEVLQQLMVKDNVIRHLMRRV